MMKPSSYAEPLKRARKTASPKSMGQGKGNAVEARAKSRCLVYPRRLIAMLIHFLRIGEDAKRRRTMSGSTSSNSKNQRQEAASEDEIDKTEKSKNIRGAAARNHRAKEIREREAAREKERAEATKRKGQNHKRKSDGRKLSMYT